MTQACITVPTYITAIVRKCGSLLPPRNHFLAAVKSVFHPTQQSTNASTTVEKVSYTAVRGRDSAL